MNISKNKIKMINKLLKYGVAVSKIARRVNLDYKEVYNYATLKQKGFVYGKYSHLIPKRVSVEKEKLLEILLNKKSPYPRIAEETRLPYMLIKQYSNARQKGFNSLNNYLNALEKKKEPAKKRKLMERLFKKGLFISEIAERVNLSYSVVYDYTRALQRFSSFAEYRNYLAQKRGFNSYYEYKKSIRLKKTSGTKKQRKFESSSDYMRDLAKRNGFSSSTEYEYYRMMKRKNQPVNKALGSLIKKRLKELGKKKSWLADQLGVGKNAVYDYISGRTKPAYRLQKKFFKLLGLPYKSIEDLQRQLESSQKRKIGNTKP